MRFTRDVEYALIGLSAMSRTTQLSSAREISEDFAVPFGILSKILQRLAQWEIVKSVQGARGGYKISRSPRDITLGEIIGAVQGVKHVVPCLDNPADCLRVDHCNIKPSISHIQTMWDKMVNSMSLEDFLLSQKQDEASTRATALVAED